jgi:hypothetical protein
MFDVCFKSAALDAKATMEQRESEGKLEFSLLTELFFTQKSHSFSIDSCIHY